MGMDMGMGNTTKAMAENDPTGLRAILTPDLLRAILKQVVPFPQTEKIDFTATTRFYFGEGQGASDYVAEFRRLTLPALSAISKVGPNPEDVPDLLTFLPHPSSSEFVKQATGLVLLLDQGPRLLFSGINMRWTTGFFDMLALRLSRQLIALPEKWRIDHLKRWTDEAGTSFEFWALVWIWIMAPFVHSESLELHQMRGQFGEDVRLMIERKAGSTDPWRKSHEKDSTDVFVFAQRVTRWPQGHMKMEDFMFWFIMVQDVCTPQDFTLLS